MIKITIKNDFRGLKKDDVYEFNPTFPELIVGKNGCGKSSLFQALRGYKNDFSENPMLSMELKKLSDNIDVEHDYEKIFFYDSVKDNGSDMNCAFDAMAYVENGGFATRFNSHGESQLIQFTIFLEKIIPSIVPGKTLFILDEVDKGFSLQLMSMYYQILINLSEKHNMNIIGITHNPLAMLKSGTVYDFVKKEIKLSTKYLYQETSMDFTDKISTVTKERGQKMRNDANAIFELTKGFTTEPTDNAMKELLVMAAYVKELTNKL